MSKFLLTLLNSVSGKIFFSLFKLGSNFISFVLSFPKKDETRLNKDCGFDSVNWLLGLSLKIVSNSSFLMFESKKFWLSIRFFSCFGSNLFISVSISQHSYLYPHKAPKEKYFFFAQTKKKEFQKKRAAAEKPKIKSKKKEPERALRTEKIFLFYP